MANRQKRRQLAEQMAKQEAQFQQVLRLSNRKKRLKKKPLQTLNRLQQVAFEFKQLAKFEQTDLALLLANFAKNNKKRNHCPLPKTYHFLRCILSQNALLLLTKTTRSCRETLRILLEFRKDWVRPIETWKAPKTNQYERILAHLIRHLFARYYVPVFLCEAWWSRHAGKHSGYDSQKDFRSCNAHFIEWFLHIGKGQNIRTAQFLPFSLTKKMAHYFLQSHEHLFITEAFRRAQVLAMGGSKQQAKRIIRTRLGNNLEHDDFWRQVVRFLLKYPALSQKEIEEIVDFIHLQKFAKPWTSDIGGENLDLPPIQPKWQIRGKTLASLKREMERWQKIPNDYFQNIENLTWKPFAIEDRELTADGVVYHLEQITTLHRLYQEGIAMNHCVGTYAHECKNGETSIWSLWAETIGGNWNCKRLVTIEVDKGRKVRQMFRKNNEDPTKLEKRLICHWMKLEGINWDS